MSQPNSNPTYPSSLRSVSDAAPCGVVLVAHAPLASAMLQAASAIVDDAHTLIEAVDIDHETPADVVEQAIAKVSGDNEEGARNVLVVADLFGGTAANLALAQLRDESVDVVTGMSLAMLVEVLLKRQSGLPLTELAKSAARAAEKSVVVASELLGAKAA